jgi:hypothetical protein
VAVADLSDKLRPVAEALSLPPEQIADARAEGGGDGPLGGLGGGEVQRQGVQALGDWFARQAESSRATE